MGNVDEALATEVVDTISALYGRHPHTRAAHAKGTWCSGTFTPSAQAASLSRAAHFSGAPVSALVRFSNGSGDPTVHDGSLDARGMSVKFDLGGGDVTDVVALSLPVFFARDADGFLAFTRARRPDPATGMPDMDVFGAFLAEHPEAMAAVQATMASRPPASFAQVRYHGIHTFWFSDAAGERRAGRYRWTPEADEASLDPADAMARGGDYLREELASRLAAGPAAFTLSVVLAGPGDPLDDPTAAWPLERDVVEMGRLVLSSIVDDPESSGQIVVFDPTHVTDGIELSDDPILHLRGAAYSVSASRRMP